MATVYWHMTSETYDEYVNIFHKLFDSAKDQNRLLHEAAKDEMRALPGFPRNANPDLDRIVPVVDDTSSRIVTFGSPD